MLSYKDSYSKDQSKLRNLKLVKGMTLDTDPELNQYQVYLNPKTYLRAVTLVQKISYKNIGHRKYKMYRCYRQQIINKNL